MKSGIKFILNFILKGVAQQFALNVDKFIIKCYIICITICRNLYMLKGELYMRCPECGSEISENDVFCGSCGAEIFYVPDASPAEQEIPDKEKTDKKSDPKHKNKKKDRKSSHSAKEKFIAAVRIICVVLIAILIIIIIVFAVMSVKAGEGKRIFDKIPLGRDVEKISAETGADFSAGKNSLYGALNYIADHDFICESEKSIDVNGIQVPEWAILLNKDGSDNVIRAVLYNFSLLRHNWMGEKTGDKIDASMIQFGMKQKEAERIIGLKPYTITKESEGNTETFTYRYHYTDEASGNNCVMNLYVVISDVDGQVKDVYDEKLDYINLILKGNSSGQSR